MYSNLY